MKILIFIPSKNESVSIKEVINNSRSEVEKFTNFSPEVLVIDDGSTDNTSEISKENKATVIRHKINIGLGEIFMEATEYAVKKNFDILITIDGDGQFDTHDIPKLLDPILKKEADFVTGNRFNSGHDIKNMPKLKQWGNKKMSKLISSIILDKYQDVSCGFRVYSKEALLNLNLNGGFTYTHEVFLNLAFKKIKIKEIPINVTYFAKRKSRIANNIFKYTFNTSKIIINSVIKYKPLKIFGRISSFLLIINLPISLILTIRYILIGALSPYKAFGIISFLLILLAIFLLIVGIILENISKLQINIDKILYYERKKQ